MGEMKPRKQDKVSLLRLPVVLAATHLVLFLITMLSGLKTASGGNPLFCVDLPVSLPLVGHDDTWTVVAVGILATIWWFFIGQVGWLSKVGKISRTSSAVGAGLTLLICAADAYAMISQFVLISREPDFSTIDVVIYMFAAALLAGGLISAGYAARAVFKSSGS
jgi:hypothetical protein